ncbi:MAG: 23S rRNA (pseudouridine(1915)-N(3))-methyltransferase RlmH [Gammaproteobacteria bacterium]|nr:23S rRNA (pseudouridine(1915)-N(3))-methyltransferase RlmH [Gammaproteobacteria bacterium]
MRIRLIAIGQKMPPWVAAGWETFAGRLPRECALELVELPAGRRGGRKGDPIRARREEGERIAGAVADGTRVVALEVGGRSWDTPGLARRLEAWRADGRDVALLVGGPDGLDPRCLERAEERWSLSPLTFPHMLVRVIVAEQIYRAWSLLNNHPYHRE